MCPPPLLSPPSLALKTIKPLPYFSFLSSLTLSFFFSSPLPNIDMALDRERERERERERKRKEKERDLAVCKIRIYGRRLKSKANLWSCHPTPSLSLFLSLSLYLSLSLSLSLPCHPFRAASPSLPRPPNSL